MIRLSRIFLIDHRERAKLEVNECKKIISRIFVIMGKWMELARNKLV
jgi:hypothetical protein